MTVNPYGNGHRLLILLINTNTNVQPMIKYVVRPGGGGGGIFCFGGSAVNYSGGASMNCQLFRRFIAEKTFI